MFSKVPEMGEYLFGIILVSEKLGGYCPRFINVFVAFIFQKPHLAMINYSMQLINIYIKSI
jgi:hypothetical protein